MTDKDLKKLNRQDLLVLLAEQTARANKLDNQLRKLEKELKERQLSINECGTLAEAAFKLSGMFQVADEAVTIYVENIKRMNDKQDQICKHIEAASKRKAEKLVEEAEEKAAEIIRNAEELAAKEIEKMDAHWDEVQRKIKEMDKEYPWLSRILQRPSGDSK